MTLSNIIKLGFETKHTVGFTVDFCPLQYIYQVVQSKPKTNLNKLGFFNFSFFYFGCLQNAMESPTVIPFLTMLKIFCYCIK